MKPTDKNKGPGRPVGFKLSDKTRQAIAKARLGSTHPPYVKDKISKSVLEWYDAQAPISKELLKLYGNDKDARRWIDDNAEFLDNDNNFYSYARLKSIEARDYNLGMRDAWVEDYSVSPEDLLIIKEEIIRREILFRKFTDKKED